jgi:DNA repair protein RadC
MTRDGGAQAVDGGAERATGSPCTAVWDGVRCRVPAVADGGLLAFFLDSAGIVILQVALDEGTRHVDELFLRHLTALINEIDAASVILVSVRADGVPQRTDRLLWREMRQRLAAAHSVLSDLLVVGDDRCWSAATRRRLRQPTPA